MALIYGSDDGAFVIGASMPRYKRGTLVHKPNHSLRAQSNTGPIQTR